MLHPFITISDDDDNEEVTVNNEYTLKCLCARAVLRLEAAQARVSVCVYAFLPLLLVYLFICCLFVYFLSCVNVALIISHFPTTLL